MRVRVPIGSRWAVAVVTAGLVVGTTTGCGDQGTGGTGLPHLSEQDRVAGEAVPFRGTLEIGPQGCLVVRPSEPPGGTADRWTLGPAGTEAVNGSGQLGNGARVEGSGRYCDALVGGVLVIDEVQHA